MKEKEMWMQKLKEKLDDYSEPMPDSGWERLEKELLPSTEKRIIPYRRRWIAAAAAVLLAAVSSVSLYFLNSPVADEIRQVAKIEPVRERTATTTTNPMIAKIDQRSEVRMPVVSGDSKEKEMIPYEEPVALDEIEKVDDSEQMVAEQPKKKEVRRPSRKDKLHLSEQSSASKSNRWSISASMGNAGALSTGSGGADGSSMSRIQMDMASSPNGVIKIPDGQTVVFQDGVPYLQENNRITDITHHQPVSFGLSVRKDLKKGFSIETGVTYTLLSSDVKRGGEAMIQDQKLHYVGIPVRANWNFLNQKLVTLYVSAGGAVEKCVYGKLAGEKQTVNPLQFSLTGAVGAQINATNRLGFYIEPGVSYFFDDGSPIQTIRKETPCNFNLQAGVRFTY